MLAPFQLIAGFFGLLSLLLVSTVGPGFAVIRRFGWAPLETLCGSVSLSLVLLYIASFLIYGLHLPAASYFAVTAVCVLLSSISAPGLLLLFRERKVHRASAGFAVLFFQGLVTCALIRDYSGGICAFDWLEHYERSLYFLRVPTQYAFLGAYHLAARPPFMNLLGTYFLAQAGTGFPVFQIIFLFLNLLTFFPLCLMAREFAGETRFSMTLLVGFLLTNPPFWWNQTWTWTKELTCFYVIFAIWLYFSGWRRNDSIRIAGAFLAISAGLLVHYSAAPYALFLLLHYVLFTFPRLEHKWRKASLTALLSAALLATWFVPSLVKFGARDTLASNTTATSFGRFSVWQGAEKTALNFITSVAPYPLVTSKRRLDTYLAQPSSAGYVRDAFMCLYDGNAIFSMGLIGGPLVLYLLLRGAKDSPGRDRSLKTFWWGFIAFCIVVGIAVNPDPSWVGVWNICGQPMTLLGIAFLSSKFQQLPLRLRWLGLVGCGIDFAVGIFLHFVLENRAQGEFLSKWAHINYAAKVSSNLTYIGDRLAFFGPISVALLILVFFVAFFRMIVAAGRYKGGREGRLQHKDGVFPGATAVEKC